MYAGFAVGVKCHAIKCDGLDKQVRQTENDSSKGDGADELDS